MNNVSLYFLLLLGLYIIATSVKNILIGTGRVKHSMYDNADKKKLALRKGVLGLVLGVIGTGLIGFFAVMILI